MKVDKQKRWFLELFDTRDIYEIPDKILEVCLENKTEVYDEYLKEYPDLTIDTLANFFERNFGDTEMLSQDFTPPDVALLIATLGALRSPKDNDVLDEAAGTGALLIQHWNLNKNVVVYARELSNATIPFLLFNLAIRNIPGVVVHGDTLTLETFEIYRLVQGEKYSLVERINREDILGLLDPLMLMHAVNKRLGPNTRWNFNENKPK